MKRSPGCLYTSDNKPLYDRQDDKMRRIEDIEEPLIEGALAPVYVNNIDSSNLI